MYIAARAMELMSTDKNRPSINLALAVFEVIAGIVLAICITGQPAKAYADPGSGAVLWQLFFASIVSIGFHFHKLRRWLAKRWPKHGRTSVPTDNG
jgi:hypothetical protein